MGQSLDRMFYRLCIFQNNVEVERGTIFHQQYTIPIKNHSPGRIDALKPYAIVFREPAELIPFNHLKVKEACDQYGKNGHDAKHGTG